jgi:hypothetical protein
MHINMWHALHQCDNASIAAISPVAGTASLSDSEARNGAAERKGPRKFTRTALKRKEGMRLVIIFQERMLALCKQ